jgi:RNA polymerase sigma factor (sigma-70 family)
MAQMKRKYGQAINNLIEQCIQGNEGAWHTLIDLVAPTVFSLCRKSRLSRDESFDIFGQVSLQLINSIEKLKSPEKIMSFVATITRRQIYTFYQHLHMDQVLEDSGIDPGVGSAPESPEERYDMLHLRTVLLEAISVLSDRDNKLIHMLFLDPREPTYEEISKTLSMPVASIGPTRAKALNKLNRLLKQKRFKI